MRSRLFQTALFVGLTLSVSIPEFTAASGRKSPRLRGKPKDPAVSIQNVGTVSPTFDRPSQEAAFPADAHPLSQAGVSEVLPAFLIDQVGFQLPEDDLFAVPGLDPAEPVFPLVSAQERGKPMGLAMIPGKYLGPVDQTGDDLSSGLISGGPGQPTVMYFGAANPRLYHRRRASGTRFGSAVEQLEKAGYLTQFFPKSGNLVGADPSEWRFDGAIGSDKMIGLRLSASGLTNLFNREPKDNRRIITQMESTVIGLSLDFGRPSYTLSEGGFRLFQISAGAPFVGGNIYNRFMKNLNFEQVSEATLRNTEYLKTVLYLNAAARGLGELKPIQVKARADSRPIAFKSSSEMPKVNVPSNLSQPVAQAILELNAGLDREEAWRDQVSGAVSRFWITSEASDLAFVQRICDELASNLGVPDRVWPRCQIGASMVPAAYAFPGGDIFVTAGLIASLENLDSLYYVLGHQIGHVVGRHATRQMPLWSALNVPNGVLAIVGNSFALPSLMRLNAGISFSDWLPSDWGGSGRYERVKSFGEELLLKSLVSILIMHSDEGHREAQAIGDEAAYLSGAQTGSLASDWARVRSYEAQLLGGKIPASFQGGEEVAAESARTRLRGLDPVSQRKRAELGMAPRNEYETIHSRYSKIAQSYQVIIRSQNSTFRSTWEDYLAKSIESPAGRGVAFALGGLK